MTGAVNEAKGANIASASTTNIGAATGNFVHITGTTTITGFGTVQAGTMRLLTFDGALTITYDVTSLILPGAVSITTAAGDCALFVSEGSGNWRCLFYQTNQSIPYLTGTWSTTWTGYSAAPTSVSTVHTLNGNIDQINVDGIAGTSNATTLTLTAPNTALYRVQITAIVLDNGTVQAAPGKAVTAVGSNVITCSKVLNTTGGWTGSGTKMIFFTMPIPI